MRTTTPASVDREHLELRSQLSNLHGLLVLAMLMTESGDEEQILRLATSSVGGLARCRAEGVYLTGEGWRWTAGSCQREPGRQAVERQLPSLGPLGGTVEVAGRLWGWAYPLRSLAGGVGFLIVSAEQAPSSAEQFLLRVLAQHAGMALANARLYAQEHATAEGLAGEQAALRRVATLVAHGASPEEVFAAVAEEVGRLLLADHTIMARYDADDIVTIVAAWSATGKVLPVGLRRPLAEASVSRLVRETRRAARFDDYAGGAAAELELGIRSAVGAPITVEGRLWGLMTVASTGVEPPPPETEARLAGFTELVATAIANAQARKELRTIADEQAALRRVATLVARASPPADVFAAVAEEVGNVLPPADFTLVGRYDDDRAVEVVGGWSRAGASALVGRRTPLGGRNVSTLVFERNQPAHVGHLTHDASPLTVAARELGMHSSAGAPISVAGRLWGVMIVASVHEEALPAGIEHRLADFTELVATAIANTQAREELRTLADEQAALRRVATLVARGEPPDAVFAAVAEEVGRLLPADLTLIGRYDDGAVTGVGGWSPTGDPGALGTRVSLGGRNVITLVFQTRRPARLDSYADASGAVAAEARGRSISSSVGVPITVAGRLWGVMVASSTYKSVLPPGTERRLADFTELVATAIANAQAQAELTASRARIVATADQTRRRIERDLHDGAQQRLVSLALQLRLAQAAVPPELEELAAELDRVVVGLNGTLDDLREIARGIHPSILSEGGLAPALRTLARRSAVPVQLDVRTAGRLPEPVEVAAYYVVSEALANAVKHAHATMVAVEVEADDDVLRVGVRDDGVGGADFASGSGLVGLKDRVEALGGRIALQSQPGSGTSLSVELPVNAGQLPDFS